MADFTTALWREAARLRRESPPAAPTPELTDDQAVQLLGSVLAGLFPQDYLDARAAQATEAGLIDAFAGLLAHLRARSTTDARRFLEVANARREVAYLILKTGSSSSSSPEEARFAWRLRPEQAADLDLEP